MRKGPKNRRAPRVLVATEDMGRQRDARSIGEFLRLDKDQDLARPELRRLGRQRDDRAARQARIREAGERARRLERERKARLRAETAMILANAQPQLRKRG
jgi:hypothetical protein